MSDSQTLVVRTVESSADWRAFFRIADSAYQGDPNYIRPLNLMRRGQLDVIGHPFYRHAERSAMICWSNGKPVGRIVAIVDRLHQQHYGDRVGFFGFFECCNQLPVARALVSAASDWLIARGCDTIRGPVNPSMKSDFGVLVEGNQYPPYLLMAHTPRYYHDLLVGCGFSVVRTFLAFALHADDTRESFRDRWQEYDALCRRVQKRYPHIKIRAARRETLAEDIRAINAVGDDVRSSGWGFVPFTPEEIDHSVKQLRKILRPEMLYLAEVDGKTVGYLILLPDLNWALQQTVGRWDWLRMVQLPFWLRRTRRTRILGIGVAKPYRQTGLAGLLIHRAFLDHGEHFRAWELSWIDSENVRSLHSATGFLPVKEYKRYQLYQQSINA